MKKKKNEQFFDWLATLKCCITLYDRHACRLDLVAGHSNNKIVKAIEMQPSATYGLSRSPANNITREQSKILPIRANFQKRLKGLDR